ncbi:MAG: TIGR03118 family protein, partial [Acidobacteriota bacterium]|nr:TIGR03118 family protein [Acidobacteriota bacterium]
MRHSRTAYGRAGSFVGVALAYLLVFAGLPAAAPAQDLAAIPTIAPGAAYRQLNFVSDTPGLAPVLDPLLVNPWGISMRGTSPFWVANAGTSTSTLYRGDVGGSPLVKNPSLAGINIPGTPEGIPTGTVGNPTNDFVVTSSAGSGPARFLFASIPGFITGWNPDADPDDAIIASAPPGGPFSRIYTGLAIGNNGSANFLYAADFRNGKIDVFNGSFALQPAASFPFTDPTPAPNALPPLYHPHNIQAIGNELFVTYARVNPVPGGDPYIRPGGAVNVFDFNGNFKRRIHLDGPAAVDPKLSAPWGLALAPSTFGVFHDALLVGNFDFDGNGRISAFDPTTGAFRGQLLGESGVPISIDGLWGIIFGNGGSGGDPGTLYFAAGIAREQHGLFGSLKPTTATATSLVRFATDDFAISEGAGHIDITVIREGDASGTATIHFNTFDQTGEGHASQKSDYEIALGDLTFNPGETGKTFRVLLVDDRFDEDEERVSLALSNPLGTGVGLGSPALATLRITDNDASTSSTNPIDDPAFFVRQHYLDFLNREPDAPGLAFWINQITSCGSDAQCTEVRRINVSAAFFLSIEFQETGLIAYLTHKAAFAERPLYGEFMRSTQALGRNFAFGTPGADAQLEANKQEFFAKFVQGPEFAAAFPTTMTPGEFVDALFENAGVTPTAAERQAAIAEFGAASTTADSGARARALRRVAENATFKQQEFTTAFVLMEYFGYLRRDPDEAGFQFWLNKLNSFGGDFVRAEMVKAFISSIEYR